MYRLCLENAYEFVVAYSRLNKWENIFKYIIFFKNFNITHSLRIQYIINAYNFETHLYMLMHVWESINIV